MIAAACGLVHACDSRGTVLRSSAACRRAKKLDFENNYFRCTGQYTRILNTQFLHVPDMELPIIWSSTVLYVSAAAVVRRYDIVTWHYHTG